MCDEFLIVLVNDVFLVCGNDCIIFVIEVVLVMGASFECVIVVVHKDDQFYRSFEISPCLSNRPILNLINVYVYSDYV